MTWCEGEICKEAESRVDRSLEKSETYNGEVFGPHDDHALKVVSFLLASVSWVLLDPLDYLDTR